MIYIATTKIINCGEKKINSAWYKGFLDLQFLDIMSSSLIKNCICAILSVFVFLFVFYCFDTILIVYLSIFLFLSVSFLICQLLRSFGQFDLVFILIGRCSCVNISYFFYFFSICKSSFALLYLL